MIDSATSQNTTADISRLVLSLLRELVTTNGFSRCVRTGATPHTDVYIVSVFPDRGVTCNGYATATQIEAFINNNADLLDVPGNLAGGWFDDGTSETFLDVSRIYTDLDSAREAALAHSQKAIYCTRTGCSIAVN